MSEKKSLYDLAKEADTRTPSSTKQGPAEAKKPASDKPAKKPIRDVGVGEDIAKGVGSGILRGLTGIFGLGGDVQTIGRMLSDYETKGAKTYTEEQLSALPPAAAEAIRTTAARPAPDMAAPTLLPTSQQVYRGLETVLPEGTLTYKPQTGPGRVAQMAGEFAGPGGLGRAPIKGALMYGTAGTAAGVGSEIDPRLGLALGLAGGVTSGGLASRQRGVEKLVGKTVGEQTPASLAAAQQRQALASQVGVPLTAAESLDSPALRTLTATVAATPEGAGVISQKLLGRQEAIPKAIEKGILGVEEAPISLTGEAARQTREAAGSAVKSVEGARTSRVTDLYEAAKVESLDPADITPIINQAKELKKTVGKDTAADIDRFINRISEMKTVNKKRKRMPITNVGKLESEYRALRDRIALDPAKIADAPTKEAKSILSDLNKSLDEALQTNENIAEARRIFQEATPEVTRVVDDSGLRAVAKTNTMDQAVQIVTNPTSATTESVGILSSRLNAQDPAVFPKIARHWLDKSAEKAKTITTKGEVPLSSGVKFVRSVRGAKGSNQEAVMNAVLDGVAQAKGINSSQMKQGFNNLLDVLQRTNLIDAFGSPTATRARAAEDVAETTGLVSRALQFDITAPTAKIGRALQQRGVERVHRQIANALVDDDAVSAIMKLASLNANSRAAQNLVANILNPAREAGQMLDQQNYDITDQGQSMSLLGD